MDSQASPSTSRELEWDKSPSFGLDAEDNLDDLEQQLFEALEDYSEPNAYKNKLSKGNMANERGSLDVLENRLKQLEQRLENAENANSFTEEVEEEEEQEEEEEEEDMEVEAERVLRNLESKLKMAEALAEQYDAQHNYTEEQPIGLENVLEEESGDWSSEGGSPAAQWAMDKNFVPEEKKELEMRARADGKRLDVAKFKDQELDGIKEEEPYLQSLKENVFTDVDKSQMELITRQRDYSMSMLQACDIDMDMNKPQFGLPPPEIGKLGSTDYGSVPAHQRPPEQQTVAELEEFKRGSIYAAPSVSEVAESITRFMNGGQQDPTTPQSSAYSTPMSTPSKIRTSPKSKFRCRSPASPGIDLNDFFEEPKPPLPEWCTDADRLERFVRECSLVSRLVMGDWFEYGTQLAVVDKDEKVTYEQLLQRVYYHCALLKDRGVKKGDSVVVVGTITVNFVVSVQAALALGAVVSVCDVQDVNSKLYFILRKCKAHFMMCESRLLGAAKKAIERAGYVEHLIVLGYRVPVCTVTCPSLKSVGAFEPLGGDQSGPPDFPWPREDDEDDEGNEEEERQRHYRQRYWSSDAPCFRQGEKQRLYSDSMLQHQITNEQTQKRITNATIRARTKRKNVQDLVGTMLVPLFRGRTIEQPSSRSKRVIQSA